MFESVTATSGYIDVGSDSDDDDYSGTDSSSSADAPLGLQVGNAGSIGGIPTAPSLRAGLFLGPVAAPTDTALRSHQQDSSNMGRRGMYDNSEPTFPWGHASSDYGIRDGFRNRGGSDFSVLEAAVAATEAADAEAAIAPTSAARTVYSPSDEDGQHHGHRTAAAASHLPSAPRFGRGKGAMMQHLATAANEEGGRHRGTFAPHDASAISGSAGTNVLLPQPPERPLRTRRFRKPRDLIDDPFLYEDHDRGDIDGVDEHGDDRCGGKDDEDYRRTSQLWRGDDDNTRKLSHTRLSGDSRKRARPPASATASIGASPSLLPALVYSEAAPPPKDRGARALWLVAHAATAAQTASAADASEAHIDRVDVVVGGSTSSVDASEVRSDRVAEEVTGQASLPDLPLQRRPVARGGARRAAAGRAARTAPSSHAYQKRALRTDGSGSGPGGADGATGPPVHSDLLLTLASSAAAAPDASTAPAPLENAPSEPPSSGSNADAMGPADVSPSVVGAGGLVTEGAGALSKKHGAKAGRGNRSSGGGGEAAQRDPGHRTVHAPGPESLRVHKRPWTTQEDDALRLALAKVVVGGGFGMA
jgi:hypothetical protein